MGITNFPHGISSFGIPIVGTGGLVTTGNIYFVSSDTAYGSDSNDGKTSETPFATLDYAIGQCTASKGDIIVLMPGHAETTTAIALDVAGIRIVGLGVGRTRPTLTATTAVSDLLDVTVASCQIENIRLVGAASGVTGLIHLAAAADFSCIGCSLEHGAAPLVAVRGTGLNPRFSFKDCIFLGTAANPDAAIDLTGSVSQCHNFTLDNCTFNYGTSAGLDESGVRTSKTNTGVSITNCRFIGMDLQAIGFASSSTGLIKEVSVVSRNATVAEMIVPGKCGVVDCRVAYQSISGARIPATTATP